MKKILFFVVVAVAFASCSAKTTNENAYYFDEVVSRLYNDPNAEMDTLVCCGYERRSCNIFAECRLRIGH